MKANGFKLTFSHGMALIGSQQDLRERVELPSADNAAAPTHILDTLKHLRGR